jgi:hypothetical protein
MAVASLSSSQAGGSALWGQIQQQQAQRNADQAEQRARALASSARDAQAVADRAQESARSLQVQSNQAQGEASEAKRGVAELSSLGEVQVQLSDLHEQISTVLKTESTTTTSATLAPVVNSFGQETGTLVNVTA